MKQNNPKWTVLYNISNGSRWVGTGWEFFDSEEAATVCFYNQRNIGNCPTKRPFSENDRQHMGAVHR